MAGGTVAPGPVIPLRCVTGEADLPCRWHGARPRALMTRRARDMGFSRMHRFRIRMTGGAPRLRTVMILVAIGTRATYRLTCVLRVTRDAIDLCMPNVFE